MVNRPWLHYSILSFLYNRNYLNNNQPIYSIFTKKYFLFDIYDSPYGK